MTLSYLRLYRSQPNYRWWRPLLAVALAAVLILSVSAAFGVLALIGFSAVTGSTPSQADVEALFVPDVAHPISVLLALASVAVWIPLIFFSLWAVGLKPVGMLNSVTLRLRWRHIGRYLIAAVVMVIGAQGVVLAVAYASGEASSTLFTLEPAVLLFSLLVVVLLVPFQAAAEEYAFRGILMQTLGSWMRTPIVPIVLPTIIFMLSHVYDIWGLLEVFLMGVTAAWLTHRTGGLEAAIVIHAINNVSVFLLLISGVFATTVVTVDASSPLSLAVTALMLAGYSLWVLKTHNRFAPRQTQPSDSEVTP